MVNSNQKGKRGEREASKAIIEALDLPEGSVRRSQQYCGDAGDADIVGVPGLHLEVKRVEKLNLYSAIEQATQDSLPGEIPVILHRRNRKPWIVALELDKLVELVDTLYKLKHPVRRYKLDDSLE